MVLLLLWIVFPHSLDQPLPDLRGTFRRKALALSAPLTLQESGRRRKQAPPPHYRFNCPNTIDKVDYGVNNRFVPKSISELQEIKRDSLQFKFMEMNYACCEKCLCYVCGGGVAAKKCPQWKWDQCLTNVTCQVVGARFCNDEPHCQKLFYVRFNRNCWNIKTNAHR